MNNAINPNIQIKRGSYESLQNYNEYIKDGEPIYDKTNKKLKIGTGIHKFSELPNLNKDYTIEFDGEYLTLKADNSTINRINIKAAEGAGIYEGSVSKKENTENTYIATSINKPNDNTAIVGDMILTENLDIWVIIDTNATVEFLANIQGPQGKSGVWTGSGDAPEGYDIQIDISGQPSNLKGTTFFPHVSEDGVLSWTNDGGLENPAPINLVSLVLNNMEQAEETSW